MERFAVGDYLFTTILDAVPSPIFFVDENVRIHGYNKAAVPLFDKKPDKVIKMRGGDALHCINSLDSPAGCGGSEACKKCVIRNSVTQSFLGDTLVRKKHDMQLVRKGQAEQIQLQVTTAPVNYQGETYVLVILENISEIEALRKILPICVKCKKIRDDKNFWQNVEAYISRYSDITFSHGICPECFKALYPDFVKE